MTLDDFDKLKGKIPDTPGVYFFLDSNKNILYIGKATSLRGRVRSYFSRDLIDTRGPLLVDMLDKAQTVEWRETDSVLEALILEASLIKKHAPRYNTELKDDKSFNYVVITKEDFPRVLVVRGKDLALSATDEKSHIFGPFPQSAQLKEALLLIRKIFPYRDTCAPCVEKKTSCKPCFNRSIGLCPGVCTGEISKAEYRRTIRHITLLFQGKKKSLLTSLEREMSRAAREERFEDATKLRGQLFALKHIRDISLIKQDRVGAVRQMRIEAYDVAHLGGTAAVGVMTVVEDDVAEKSEYKKFRIRSAKAGDDVGALREILSRRLEHTEWQFPKLIVVDGGTAQIHAAEKVLREVGITVPIVGVVKDEHHRPREIRGDKKLATEYERSIILANAEAHRFAIGYHRKQLRARGVQ